MFLWGSLRRASEVVGTEGRGSCQRCGRRTQYLRVRQRKSVALYGIPLGEYGNAQSVICSRCGAASSQQSDRMVALADQYSQLDAWDRVMAGPFKGRRLKNAVYRGRTKGLQLFQERYGSSTTIDKRWLRRNRDEIRQILYSALLDEIQGAKVGLREEQISGRVNHLAQTIYKEMKAAV